MKFLYIFLTGTLTFSLGNWNILAQDDFEDLMGMLDEMEEKDEAPEEPPVPDEPATNLFPENVEMLIPEFEEEPKSQPILEEPVIEEESEVIIIEEIEQETQAIPPAPPSIPEAIPMDPVPPQKDQRRMAREISYREEVKRQALEEEAYIALQQGYEALANKQWKFAEEKLSEAKEKFPVRNDNLDNIQRTNHGIAQANYELAAEEYRKRKTGGSLQIAQERIAAALAAQPSHKASQRLNGRIQKWADSGEFVMPFKKIKKYTDRREKIIQLMDEGRQLYYLRDFDAAAEKFEEVLQEDEFNEQAINFLKKVSEKKYEYATRQRQFSVEEMMYKTRDGWNLPLAERHVKPQNLKGDSISPIPAHREAQEIEGRMREIIIPDLSFRNANIIDVINFLVETSRQMDKEKNIGVNILLNLGTTSETSESPEPEADPLENVFDDEFGLEDDSFGGGAEESESVGSSAIPTITLNLKGISLYDALGFVTEITGLSYRIERGVVVIRRKGVVEGIITRFYPVDPTLMQDFQASVSGGDLGGGGDTFDDFSDFGGGDTVESAPGSDIKAKFESYGVPFPEGTSIIYQPVISRLIVANTPENLEKFEEVLSLLNVVPRQIQIEARFIEVLQSDMEEAGLEWIFTDNYEFAVKDGSAPIAARERIQVDADLQGVTKGLRFFNFDPQQANESRPRTSATRGTTPFLSNILSLSGVLTNPELRVVLHLLDQKGHSDLLSAPRVTTLNGVNAQIEVVTEIIYPTEFEVTTIEARDIVLTDSSVNFFAVTPGAFETRETGVILNVTPSVMPDNYTLSLTMVPEIAELVDWIQYGSVRNGELLNMPQPIFTSRNVTTTMIVWDGHTVVMGGLIREDMVSFEDKVPLLGDIPFLGRLFRSEGQSSQKRNLLIFVTATLVNPAGEPLNKRQDNLELVNTTLNPEK